MKTFLKTIGYILGLIVLILIGGMIFGPEAAIVHIETEIDAPAEEVWAVLAHDFADIEEWTETVSESRAIDASELPDGLVPAENAPVIGRVTTSPVLTAYEIIVDYDEDAMMLKFEAGNLPALLSYADDRQTVVAKGENKSVVMFDARLELAPYLRLLNPVFGSRFEATMADLQQELKLYVESGGGQD